MIPAAPSSTATLSVLLGAGTGVGLLLILHPRRLPARPRLRIPRRYGRRVVLAVSAGLLSAVATGWVISAPLCGWALWVLPRVLGRARDDREQLARTEAIATWTEMLRDTLAAAAGLEQAILATRTLAPAPIREHIQELATGIENGQRLPTGLRRLCERLDDPVGDLVIAALLLACEHATRRLGELLGSLAAAARGHAAMRVRVAAGRTRTHTSVRVIAGTTVAFALAVVMLNRDYLAAYDTATGQLVLAGIGGLFAGGFAWLHHIARITGPDRVMHPSTPATPKSGPPTRGAPAAGGRHTAQEVAP